MNYQDRVNKKAARYLLEAKSYVYMDFFRMENEKPRVPKKMCALNAVIMIDTGRLDYSSFFAFIVRPSALPFLESTFSIASGFIRDYFLVFIRFTLR